jgi:hypothetical protein
MRKNNKFIPVVFTLLAFGAVALVLLLLLQFPAKEEIAVGSAVQQEQPTTATHPADSPLDTPTAIPTPYVTATPAPTLPSVDKLDPGLKLVYTETDETGNKTAVRIANVNKLEQSKHLATFEHRLGYGVQGSVSPDGKWIAIKLIPPNIGQRGLRMYGGELWMMQTDGTELHQLPGRVRGIIEWSPQGEVTIESGVDIVNPTMPEDSNRSEYYAVTPAGEVTKIMGATLENVAIDPVGWSADGFEFYYTWRGMGVGDLALGTWELRAINRKDGLVRSVMKAPYKAAQAPSLLASRTHIAYVAYTETKQLNIVSDINGENAVILNEAARNEDLKFWLWSLLSPVNDSLLLRGLPEKDKATVDLTRVQLMNSKEPIFQSVAKIDASFLPVRWSPDEQWVVLDRIPSDPSFVGIMNLVEGFLVDIPKAQSENGINVWGWVSN